LHRWPGIEPELAIAELFHDMNSGPDLNAAPYETFREEIQHCP
jgi:hypothetical protein